MLRCGDTDVRKAAKGCTKGAGDIHGADARSVHGTVMAGREVSCMISCLEFGEMHVGDLADMWKMVLMRDF